MRSHKVIIVLIILLLSTFIRFWKMEYLPLQNDADELADTYAGLSLIEKGLPISWTVFWKEYQNSYGTHIPKGDDLRINSPRVTDFFYGPWFDHTPLLPLFIGTYTHLLGFHFQDAVPSLYLHLPMICLSLVTLSTIFYLSYLVFGYRGGLVSLLLAGYSPSLAISERMVVSENIVILLLLLTSIFIIKSSSIWIPSVLLGLAGLSKITALSGILAASLYLWITHRRKSMVLLIVISLSLFFITIITYAFHYDIHQFIKITLVQGSRPIGWLTLTKILTEPGFTTWQINMPDTFYYLIAGLGLAGFIKSLSFQSSSMFLIRSQVIGAILTLWFTSSQNAVYGWYKIPLFCLLCVMAGAWAKGKYFQMALWCLIVSALTNIGLLIPASSFLSVWVRLAVIAIAIMWFLIETSRMNEKVLFSLTVLVSFASALFVVNGYFDQICNPTTCTYPLVTLRQFLNL